VLSDHRAVGTYDPAAAAAAPAVVDAPSPPRPRDRLPPALHRHPPPPALQIDRRHRDHEVLKYRTFEPKTLRSPTRDTTPAASIFTRGAPVTHHRAMADLAAPVIVDPHRPPLAPLRRVLVRSAGRYPPLTRSTRFCRTLPPTAYCYCAHTPHALSLAMPPTPALTRTAPPATRPAESSADGLREGRAVRCRSGACDVALEAVQQPPVDAVQPSQPPRDPGDVPAIGERGVARPAEPPGGGPRSSHRRSSTPATVTMKYRTPQPVHRRTPYAARTRR
jgi:hypothetical protein